MERNDMNRPTLFNSIIFQKNMTKYVSLMRSFIQDVCTYWSQRHMEWTFEHQEEGYS